jgi:hypothetical protein
LTSAHQETGAVDGPRAFEIHKYFLWPFAGPLMVSGFDRAGSGSADACVQVERLYAQKKHGSIT